MWLVLRVLALTAAFVCGCLFDPFGQLLAELDGPAAEMLPDWGMPFVFWLLVALSALLAPVLVLAAVGVQVINPFRSRVFFSKPGWRTRFVNLNDPAHFFHLFGYMSIAAGVGRTVVQLAAKGTVGQSGIGWLLGGVGFLSGVRLCMCVYRSYYEEDKAAMCSGPRELV